MFGDLDLLTALILKMKKGTYYIWLKNERNRIKDNYK